MNIPVRSNVFMNRIFFLENKIQEYAWGSTTAIADLTGKPVPSERPQAELWMGAHPKAPSRVIQKGRLHSLLELINDNPENILGRKTAARFHNSLPFLFKVLAAERPLSIQSHPSLKQAKDGFDRENNNNIPLTAPFRNYKDSNHKPEIICALTPYWALNGFRKISRILELFALVNPQMLAQDLALLQQNPDRDGLKHFFTRLISKDSQQTRQIVGETTAYAKAHETEDDIWSWTVKLNSEFPGDAGVLGPILLNLVLLQPGEAMYLPSGQLHAYLNGVGIELMANSDNVLRGGLTEKHIDVPELLLALTFQDQDVTILRAQATENGAEVYRTDAKEFELSRLTISPDNPFCSAESRSVEIQICTEGQGLVTDLSDVADLPIRKGCSFIVPSSVKQYRISGDLTMYRATVPV